MGLIKKLRKAKKEALPNEKPAVVKTHLRDMIIVPEMIGSVVGIYNGKVCIIYDGRGGEDSYLWAWYWCLSFFLRRCSIRSKSNRKWRATTSASSHALIDRSNTVVLVLAQHTVSSHFSTFHKNFVSTSSTASRLYVNIFVATVLCVDLTFSFKVFPSSNLVSLYLYTKNIMMQLIGMQDHDSWVD